MLMVRTATYYCFLTNGSPDLLKIKLARGFHLEQFDLNAIIDMIIKIGDNSAFNPINRIITNLSYSGTDSDENSDCWYAIVKQVNSSDIDRVENHLENDVRAPLLEQEDERYIQKIILFLNLYKECSVFSSDRFILVDYHYESVIWHRCVGQPVPTAIYEFYLSDQEQEELQALLDSDYPFNEPYIQLAFDNFIESHYIENPKLSMLMLMMALEALFSRGNSEISHTIARSCAVLLGEYRKDSREIYEEVKGYYNARSVLIHGQVSKKSEVTLIDVYNLRDIVRRSINHLLTNRMEKDELICWLDEMGYPE